ncbi:hypothetical protein M2428_000823 [Arthrobacter sp. ES3-54]|jgi:hypothetical protein|nr:hypothetical protein [Arthrobacter sp. ES3-54]
MVEQLTAFVLTCLVVALVPGPDFALVLRNAARGPRAAESDRLSLSAPNQPDCRREFGRGPGRGWRHDPDADAGFRLAEPYSRSL